MIFIGYGNSFLRIVHCTPGALLFWIGCLDDDPVWYVLAVLLRMWATIGLEKERLYWLLAFQ